jgi:hypothetical protein
MKLRTLAASAAVAVTASIALVPSAGAQDARAVGELLSVINGGIESADCNVVRVPLEGLGLVDESTTRGELVADLRENLGDDATFQLVSTPTINTIGDKALKCKIVQPDPLDPAALSSALISGDFTTIIDTLPSLSSQFNLDFDVPFPGLG